MQLLELSPFLGRLPSEIEKGTEELVRILFRSFEGLAKKSLPHDKGHGPTLSFAHRLT